MKLEEFSSFVQELLKETGRIIISHYSDQNLQIESKEDATPVTRADREVEAYLRKIIEKTYPHHGIVGEEYGSMSENAEYVWLLDPIDGTHSFVTKVPLFGTVLCLKKRGVPLLGAIHQPIMNLLMIGDDNQTTLKDRLVKVRTTEEMGRSTILTSDELNAQRRFGKDNWENLVNKAALYRTWGDCFGYLSLASGNADVMIDPIVNPWDFHAMIPIIRGAGGIITDHKGNDALKGNSVVASNHKLHPLIIDHLAG